LATAGTERERAIALSIIGDRLVDEHDYPAAIEQRTLVVEALKKTANADSTSMGAQRDLSIALERLSLSMLTTNDFAGAQQQSEEALRIAESLLKAEPTARAQLDVAETLSKLGDILMLRGQPDDALTRYQRSHDIRLGVAVKNPGTAVLQRLVSVSLAKRGDALLAKGNVQAARGEYKNSVTVHRGLVAREPQSEFLKVELGQFLYKFGDAQMWLKETAARDSYEESLRILKAVSSGPTPSIDALRHQSTCLTRLGDLLLTMNDRAGAEANFRDSLQISKDLLKKTPESAALQRDVAIGLKWLGQATGQKLYFVDSLTVFEALRSKGQLAPYDEELVADLRRRAGS
jgi:tetratricopeptide (TPR) repeat protein